MIRKSLAMFNKRQVKRLSIVFIIPLLAIGIWLEDGGYRKFVANQYHGVCYLDGVCGQMNEALSLSLYNKQNVLYVGFPESRNGFWGHILYYEDIKYSVVYPKTGDERVIEFPSGKRTDDSAYAQCKLEHTQSYGIIKDGTEKKLLFPETHRGLFTITCGFKNSGAASPFYFKNPEIHNNLVTATENASKHRRDYLNNENNLSTIAFFSPFIVFFGIILLMALVTKLFRYVKGSEEENK